MAYRRRFKRRHRSRLALMRAQYRGHKRAMDYHWKYKKRGFLRKYWYHEACNVQIAMEKRPLTKRDKRYQWNRFKNN